MRMAVGLCGGGKLLLRLSTEHLVRVTRTQTTWSGVVATKGSAEEKRRKKEVESLIEQAQYAEDNKARGWSTELSGDRAEFKELTEGELDLPVPELQACSEKLKTCPDVLRKAHSLRFAKHSSHLAHRIQETMRKYQLHIDDELSYEARVVRQTVQLRNLQRHLKVMPKDGNARLVASNLATKRNNLLFRLRDWNEEQLELMLSELQLDHIPRLPYPGIWKIRNKYLRKFVVERYFAAKAERMAALKAHLEEEKKKFAEEKQRLLAEIAADESDLKISKSDKEEVLRPRHLVPGQDGMREPPLKVAAP